MGKRKITSLFVIAAAMLLALPVQAQLKFTREEVKAMTYVKKAVGEPRSLSQEFEKAYPFIAKQMAKINRPSRLKGATSATVSIPVGPRKTAKVKNMGGQSLIPATTCDILASNIYDYAVTGENAGYVQMFNTGDATNAEVLATGDSYTTFGSTNGGGLIEGNYYGAELMSFLGMFYFPELYTYSMEDGTADYLNLEDFALMALYDTATAPSGDVYGVFSTADGSNVEFGIADYENLTHSAISTWNNSEVPYVFGISSDNVGYMIMTDHNFYKVNLATGDAELIGAIDYPFYDYYQTGEIDQKTNTFYWLALNEDLTSSLVTVDLETAETTEICNLGDVLYENAVIMAPAAEDEAPAAISDLKGEFIDDALTGTITFTAPSSTFAGEELSGSLNFYVNVAGEVVKEGITTAGEEVSVEVTVPAGMQTIFVTTKNDTGMSPKSNKIKQWFGLDEPSTPQNVVFNYADGVATVTWDAVTTGVHNGFIGNVGYIVVRYLNGHIDGASEILYETEFSEELTIDEMTAVYYSVIAGNEGFASSEGYSNKMAIGNPLEVPYTADFANESTFDLFSVIDANEDGTTWKLITYTDYDTGEVTGRYAAYTYSSLNDADDWLTTPAVNITAGKNYNVVVSAAAYSDYYPERFEVKWGYAPDALTHTVIPATDLTTTEFNDYEGSFMPEEEGPIYVGIHAISDADMYNLLIASLTIEPGLKENSPKAPRLAVQPDPYGAEKAVITVTAPIYDVQGNKLEELSSMIVKRDNEVIATFSEIKPADIKVFIDEVSGQHSYRAIAYDTEGDAGVKGQIITKFIGLDVPTYPDELEAQELADGTSLISWKKVTTGANGGIVNPDEITYSIYEGVNSSSGWSFGDMVATTNDCFYVVDNDNTSEQHLQMYFVLASNEAGEGGYNGAYTFAGAPYTLPYEEHFAPEGWNYGTWLYGISSGAVSLLNSDDASDGDGAVTNDGPLGALEFSSTEADEWGYLCGGKVAMHQGNMVLLIDAKGDGSEKNALVIQITTPDGKTKDVARIYPDEEYENYFISLEDFCAEKFVKFTIYADFKEAGKMVFDNIKILDLMEYNLSVAIDAPEMIQAGQTAPIKVVVRNMGEETVNEYTVKLYANDEPLLVMPVMDDELETFEKRTFEAELETTIFDDAQDVTLTAEVEFDYDLDDEDNIAEAIVTIAESNVPQPENVVAERVDNDVVLTWDAASAATEDVFENFEDGLNGWKAIDADGDGYSWYYHVNSGSGNYQTHSGDGCIYSESYNNSIGALYPDNWIVSPVVALDGTFSFWAVGQDPSYAAEHFAVFVSTTSDTDLESFVQVSDEFIATGEWAQFTVDLSAFNGAEGYIAIRHFNVTDEYVLVIDDITYQKTSGQPAGYNIYVDGEDGVYDTTTETTYTIKDAGSIEWAAVSAVTGTGKESKPVVVEISGANQQITAIEQVTGNNKPVDIYSLDGKLIREQATNLKGLHGAYVINGTKVLIK